MRYSALAAVFAASAIKGSVAQDFDWDAIDALVAIPDPDIPIVASEAVASATTVSFEPTPAASTVFSAVTADPTDSTPVDKRDDSACASANTPSSTDTAANFEADQDFSNTANTAPIPTGYVNTFTNLNGSATGGYGYMGYTVLQSYDTVGCAAQCNAIIGCSAFNVYYERDASVTPTTSCSNPSSQTVIKCVFWGGDIQAGSATNTGQYQDDFQVVIAGSNGYVNNSISDAAGYAAPTYLGNAAINALNDCNGYYTYMGVKIFTSGPFDAGLCAAACSATSAYNVAHPPKNAPPQTCQFFNTYVLYNNSRSVGQYCAMYNETWPAADATNTGQYRGPNHYTVGYSYSFSNATNPGTPVGCTNKRGILSKFFA